MWNQVWAEKDSEDEKRIYVHLPVNTWVQESSVLTVKTTCHMNHPLVCVRVYVKGILSLFPEASRTDQDIPGILGLSSQPRPLLFKGDGVHVCVFLDLHGLFRLPPDDPPGQRGDAPWAILFVNHSHVFAILKSQESPWQMLQEGCLISASLWCIPLAGWKQGTPQTNSFTLFNSSCLLFLSVVQCRSYWATSLKECGILGNTLFFLLTFLPIVRSADW